MSGVYRYNVKHPGTSLVNRRLCGRRFANFGRTEDTAEIFVRHGRNLPLEIERLTLAVEKRGRILMDIPEYGRTWNSSKTVFLGIDGGQSGSKCILADSEGRVLKAFRVSPSDSLFVPNGELIFKRMFDECCMALTESFEGQYLRLGTAVLGLSGVVSFESAEARRISELFLDSLESAFGKSSRPAIVHVDSDAVVAWAGAGLCGPGAVIAAGTGVVCYGENESMQRARAGGWGSLMGDEGGGFWIGRQALLTATRSEDGIIGPTLLKEAVAKAFEAPNVQELYRKLVVLQDESIKREKVAALVPRVVECARRGDIHAERILREAGVHLAQVAIAVIKKLGGGQDTTLKLRTTGGIFRAGGPIADSFHQTIRREFPSLSVEPAVLPGDIGAILYGWKLNGLEFSGDRIKRLLEFDELRNQTPGRPGEGGDVSGEINSG